MKPTKKNIVYMLKESNAIEGVHGKTSISCARRAFEYLLKYDSLNTQNILYAHKLLMANQDLENKYKGKWRDIPVYIGGVKKSDPPLVIDNKIKQWCILANKSKIDPVELHVRFENIHPFVDGNGRIGRILLNWQQMKMKANLIVYTEAERQEYYKLFQKPTMGKLLQDMMMLNARDL